MNTEISKYISIIKALKTLSIHLDLLLYCNAELVSC